MGDAEYLNNSYYLDPDTGKRIAHELEEDELSRFTTSWGLAPIECIRAVNRSIREITEPDRRDRYVRAAVDLEILMDQQNWTKGDGKVYQGIPSYLMNGYTDMGTLPSPTERAGREKIKVDKKQMKNRLVQCKRVGLDLKEPDVGTLALFYETVRKDIEFDERGVERLSREYGNESIVLSEYLNKGMGVCRHLSIFYQLYLQEVGIESRVVKGNLRFYIFTGRHAWNLVKLGDRVVLADVTHPDVKSPFILMGSDEEDVYKRAKEFDRTYVATPDEQNYYKIGA
jgi:transglutaminase/protease-like cytokinesis protein 3